MTPWVIISFAVLTWAMGKTSVTEKPEELMDNTPPVTAKAVVEEVLAVMETGELNPNHYPAQRAAKAVQHYINTRHGSPFRVFTLHRVHSGNAEDVANSGRRYQLEISVQDMLSKNTYKCSSEIIFPRERQGSPEVHVSCEDLEKLNTSKDDETFYKKLKTRTSLLSTQNLPDSHGRMDSDMKPLWHLGIVASSFIMLQESTENTLYNMAQVGNVTQLATDSDELKFEYFVLLHDMISQEILRWNLQISWSPQEGVKILQKEKLPHCHECKQPPATD